MSIDNNTYGTPTQSALHLLRQWQVFMEGIDRIYAFWGKPSSPETIQGIEWQDKRSDSDQLLSLDSNIAQAFQKNTTNSAATQWLKASNLPFSSAQEPRIGQLDLFSESNYLVLHIRVSLELNQSVAWYYLFFRNDKSNFGIAEQQSALTTSEKAIIARLAQNFAYGCLKAHNENIQATGRLKQNTQNLLKARHEDIQNIKHELQNWQIQYLDSFLDKLSQRDGLHYVISNECKKTLFNKCSSLRQLEESIENSIVYICELYNYEPGDELEIDTTHLHIASPQNDDTVESANPPLNRTTKTIQLLDKLESSALKVLQTGFKLTSAEVGKQMDKAITAPAISDALKKNKVRILQLFAQHPHRWTTIRSQFKPVVNLNEKNKAQLNTTS